MGSGRQESHLGLGGARAAARLDGIIAALLFLGCFGLYARTLAPSVVDVFSDTLEFQLAGPTLAIAHETGYPLYTLLSWLIAHLLPLGNTAFRVNLLSALCASLAVALVYRVAQLLTPHRLAAACGAFIFALAPIWWSQAVIAEVYALHGLLIALTLWLVLRWAGSRPGDTEAATLPADRERLGLLAVLFAVGLSMAHHRMTLLLVPALAVFVLWTEPALLRQPRRWPLLLAALLVPLLLYVYIPLRGLVTTSLDGRYETTWQGFWSWVMASQYGAFLSGNPFGLQRDAGFYGSLFRSQFGWLGLVVGVLGFAALWRRRRHWALLTLAFVANLAFALSYRAADVEVFFIPAFLLWSLFVAAGIGEVTDALAHLARQGSELPNRGSRLAGQLTRTVPPFLLAAACLLQPILMARASFPSVDRSADWSVHDYGRDMLQQPLPQGSALVGLLGEMTLLRYFQRTEGLRPDLITVAADSEEERHAALHTALAEGRAVYITRPLAGAPERYSLAAVGPLVQVWPKGQAQPAQLPHSMGLPLGDAVVLTGWGHEIVPSHAGPTVRLALLWRVVAPPSDELKVSVRLLDGSGAVVVATDEVPVHNTYPTWAWLPGEAIADSYDLPLPAGAELGPYRLLVILYRAADGGEVGRAELGEISVR